MPGSGCPAYNYWIPVFTGMTEAIDFYCGVIHYLTRWEAWVPKMAEVKDTPDVIDKETGLSVEPGVAVLDIPIRVAFSRQGHI